MNEMRLPGQRRAALRFQGHVPLGEILAETPIICIAEDPAYAERMLLPELQWAGAHVDLGAMDDPIDLDRRPYRLILMDIGSRKDSNFYLCAQVRSATRLPLMVVLRGAAREEVVRSLQAGADAYILAPFDPREFLARAGALVRREIAGRLA